MGNVHAQYHSTEILGSRSAVRLVWWTERKRCSSRRLYPGPALIRSTAAMPGPDRVADRIKCTRRRGIAAAITVVILLIIFAVASGVTWARSRKRAKRADGVADGVAGAAAAAVDVPLEERVYTVVTNASVWTVNPGEGKELVEAFAYDQEGVIRFVGNQVDVMKEVGDGPTVVDALKYFVMPGFQDPHVHMVEAGLRKSYCELKRDQSLKSYEDAARDCSEQQKDSDWVRMFGVSVAALLEEAAKGELPIDTLSNAIQDRPAIVLDDIGNACWVNRVALEKAQITDDSIDPAGGIIHREEGRLTGLLLENAQHLVLDAAVEDADTQYEALRKTMKELSSKGVTSVSDAGGFWLRKFQDSFRTAEEKRAFTVRTFHSVYVYPDQVMDQQLAKLKELFEDKTFGFARVNTAIIHVDGALDLGTAALLTSYEDPLIPSHPSGILYFSEEDLNSYCVSLHEIGYRLSFQATGDRAVQAVLAALQVLHDKFGSEAVVGRRHRTTHNALISQNDLSRFKELGLLVDLQMDQRAISKSFAKSLYDSIGSDLAKTLIPARALLDASAHVSLSSDYPYSKLSPVGTIARAVTRESGGDDVQDVATAIRLVTLDAAYALGDDQKELGTGSIEVGKMANYVVLSKNLIEVDEKKIAEAKVLRTVLQGKNTFDALPKRRD